MFSFSAPSTSALPSVGINPDISAATAAATTAATTVSSSATAAASIPAPAESRNGGGGGGSGERKVKNSFIQDKESPEELPAPPPVLDKAHDKVNGDKSEFAKVSDDMSELVFHLNSIQSDISELAGRPISVYDEEDASKDC